MDSAMKKIGKILPYTVLGGILLLLVLLNAFYQLHWLDSDMAAEMMFSKLLAETNHVFATPDWYYSTEFRFLYTQLIMAPLFKIMDNWHIIRMITNLVFYGLLLASYYYFMKPFRVKRSLVILTSVLLFLPFSETMMTHVQIGNTYMPHMIIVFLFFGMFLRLAAGNIRKARRLEILCFYFALAAICGISGVRYLFVLQCPLVLAAFLYVLKSDSFQTFRKEMTGENFGKIIGAEEFRYFVYSLLGILGSVVGYAVNVLYVSRKYVFQTYESTLFIPIYQGELFDRLQNALGCLLMLFGYIPERAVLSMRGIVTVCAFVLLGVFIWCTVKARKDSDGRRSFTVLFLVTAFCLNMFVFVFTTSTMVPRYYLTIFIFVLPVLCFYFEGKHPGFDKIAVAVLLVGCLLLGTAKVVLSFVTVDKNKNRYQVAAFLEENDYHFGFATYTNGNIITEITNGVVEIGNVNDPEHLDYFTWSSPMKYYEEDYCEGEVFLLLTKEEENTYADAQALQIGEKVYDDGCFGVYVFDSVQQLRDCAEER